jgi:peptidoglycan/LPS O-acetylase OafA/YrhL
MKAYLKAAAAVVVAALGALVVALGPGGDKTLGDLSATDWLTAALAVLASGGMVWLVENTGAAAVAKAAIAFLTAGFGSLIVALDDNDITQTEWLTAVGASIVATGFVYQLANQTE